jgi:hypothetical protein
VLGRGETWVGRAELGGETYLAAYLALGDAAGRRVGMLAVGVVDAPLQQARRSVLLGIGGVLLALMAAAAWLALRWSRERDDDDDDELLTVVLPFEPEPEPEPEPMVGPIAADPEPPPAAGPVRPATDA